MRRFENQVVVITGGTSGIGRAAALAFAREGARVVIGGRRQAEGQAVVDEIEQAGGQARFKATDVTREADVQALVADAVTTWGRLDVAFNNAGVEESGPGSLVETSAEQIARVLDVNVKGLLFSLKHEAAAMLKSGGGVIVNTTSSLGHVGIAGAATYSGSKWAAEGITKSVALELAPRGIRVNAVAPGAIATDMIKRAFGEGEGQKQLAALHPLGRIGRSEEVAAAVLFLSERSNGFLTGASLLVDGGFTAR